MIQLYYRWRYRRTQQAASYRMPRERQGRSGLSQGKLLSYLSQTSVRGRALKRMGFPRIDRSLLQRISVLCLFALVGWMAYESALALIIFGD